MNAKELKVFYRQSKVFLLAEKVSAFVSQIIYSSFLYKILFYDAGGEKFFSASISSCVLNFFIKIFMWPQNFFSCLFENSLCKNFLDLIFVPYVPQFALSSIFIKFLSEFFGIDIKKSDKKSGLIFFVIAFVLFLVGIKFVGLKKSMFVIGGILFSLLVLHDTKIGVFVLAFFIALLPTKFILAIVLLTIFSFGFNLVFTNHFSLSVNLIDLFVILFGSLIFYSIFISYIPLGSFKMATVYLLFITFYFACKNVIGSRNDLFTVVSLMIVSSAIVALIGIGQKYFGLVLDTNMWIDVDMFENNTVRVFSTLDNPNVLGEYLLFMIPVSFGSIYYFKNKFYKAVSFFTVSLLCVCMLLTLSRGAWLGLITAMFVFIVLRDKKILWFAAFLVFLLPLFVPQSFIERFMSIGNMADSSTSYRVGIWIASLRIIKDFWPIGIGMGTQVFIFIFQKYALSASYALHSHNFYLQLIIDLGIAGFILMFFLVLLLYKNLLVENRFLCDDFVKTFKISLCAGFTGYLVQGLADNVWYNYRIVLLFWFMIAISASCFNLSKLSVWEKFKFFQHKSKFN